MFGTTLRLKGLNSSGKRGFFDVLSKSEQVSKLPTKKHHERRLLRFPAPLLYEVVSDVAQYEKFVPWCKRSTVLSHSPTAMKAELEVGFQVFSEKYISEVALEPHRSVVASSSHTQLFEHLRSEWHFQPANGDLSSTSTWVNFSVEFRFKSAVYNEVSELFMQEVVKKMVRAFEQRCRELQTAREK